MTEPSADNSGLESPSPASSEPVTPESVAPNSAATGSDVPAPETPTQFGGDASAESQDNLNLETANSELRVRLPVFEGPLDLLLYLIKKDELDIYDIPIEHIARQYLGYLQVMRMLDLEVAGEFLVVASTLLYIKSRTLLPKDLQPPEEEAEEDDPRWDLIRQLVEYKKFKDAAWQLHLKQMEQGKTFQRGAEEVLPERTTGNAVGDVGIFDLINAFQKVLARVNSREDLKEIFEDRFTVSDKINTIRQMMQGKERIFFEDLFIGVASRTEIVVTFLALLELIRMKFLCVVQPDPFAEIEISHSGNTTPLFNHPITSASGESVAVEPEASAAPVESAPETAAEVEPEAETEGEENPAEVTEQEPEAVSQPETQAEAESEENNQEVVSEGEVAAEPQVEVESAAEPAPETETESTPTPEPEESSTSEEPSREESPQEPPR